ncbi:MAG: SCO family protein [Moraxellaceae bacterium]
MLSRKQLLIMAVATTLFFLVVMLGTQYLAKRRALEALPVNTKMGGDFILPSTQGQLNTQTLRGKVVLLNFGFTSCPDVCPLVLARLKQVLKELGDDAADTQVVFVSFDPERDTLPNLTAYVQHFNPAIIGATGSDAEIATVAAQYGVIYIKEKGNSAAGYNFAHSDYIYLLDTQGRLRKLYANDTKTAEIVADVRLLQSADKGLF